MTATVREGPGARRARTKEIDSSLLIEDNRAELSVK
jgi:hypothetical protein